jgi:hypothetical protein
MVFTIATQPQHRPPYGAWVESFYLGGEEGAKAFLCGAVS